MKEMMNESTMGAMSHMMSSPVAKGAAMMGAGYAARGIVGRSLLTSPLVVLAAGVAAGYLLHAYRKEIVLAVSKATGMGKDFLLEQKESLADLVAESKDQEAQEAAPAASEARPTGETPAAGA